MTKVVIGVAILLIVILIILYTTNAKSKKAETMIDEIEDNIEDIDKLKDVVGDDIKAINLQQEKNINGGDLTRDKIKQIIK